MKLNGSTLKQDLMRLPHKLAIAEKNISFEQTQIDQLLADIESKRASMNSLTVLHEAQRQLRRRKLAPLLNLYHEVNEQIVLFLGERLKLPEGLSIKQQDDVAYLGLRLSTRLKSNGSISLSLQEAIDQFQTHQSNRKESPVAPLKIAQNRTQEPEAAEFVFKNKKPRAKKSLHTGESVIAEPKLALRSIYRKLVSALHPDRATNEAERLRKTSLMARVNMANDRGDLSALMHLQHEAHLVNLDLNERLTPERLLAVNTALREQLAQLNSERQLLEQNIRQEFGLSYGAINQKTLKVAARSELASLQFSIDSLADTLQLIRTHRNFKNWIKQQVQFFEDLIDIP
jgi:hypothetical protein